MKTSELTGAALDWAVAKLEEPSLTFETFKEEWERYNCAASIDWSQGGPIIEREGIDLHRVTGALWSASWWANNSGMAKNPAQRFKYNVYTDGPTPLIAAMRCYVHAKLGDEVDVPGELA